MAVGFAARSIRDQNVFMARLAEQAKTRTSVPLKEPRARFGLV